MPQLLHVHLLPDLIEPGALHDGTAVIIDILRASSTIITALSNGAERVIPCGTPEEAHHCRLRLPPGSSVLGGERGGVRIDGFDYGNSPAEYGASAVSGRTVAFTTTNGTKALLKSLSARDILIGGFLNRHALIERLEQHRSATHLICAGTDGVITGEDVLFAGAVVDGLVQRASMSMRTQAGWTLNDSAQIAMNYWRHCLQENQSLDLTEIIERELMRTRGGRNLVSLGYESDIARCSCLDTINIVPQFDRAGYCLVATS
jgi:2-phosphosulfolactate phosphatase